ncbi:putative NADH dehydrogenase [Operophtera brumata]|uniref:Putative NADH dehydrogenase n=1 Tax=Operophtera brumata TaxID=104452 RepID=A0A0L7LQ99_OPEBR|nr:putative NADH dehydrogenase [Operophtera brumata]
MSLKLLVYRGLIATTSLRFSDELAVHRDSPENNATTPFEFTEPNLARIAAQIQNYPEGCHRSALGAALDIAQRQMGWLPISAMHKVAEILSIPRVRVYEYATFYTMNKRHSRGKYHVKICATTPCMLMGAESILMAAEDACGCKAGSVSSDGMFGVDTVERTSPWVKSKKSYRQYAVAAYRRPDLGMEGLAVNRCVVPHP